MRPRFSRLLIVLVVSLSWCLATERADAAVPMSGVLREKSSSVMLDAIPTVKRGKRGVQAQALTGYADWTCRLTILYADGKVDTVPDAKSDSNGICTMRFNVPDRRLAVGTATARLKVFSGKTTVRGKDGRTFTVR